MPTLINTVFQAMYRELLFEFLAELLHATRTADTPATFPRIVQIFYDEPRPWLAPVDVPGCPALSFPSLTTA
jgi:hypothetical protein